jgi:hypothetical protein
VAVNGTATDNLSGVSSTMFQVDDEYHLVQPKISDFNSSLKLDAWCDEKDTNGRTYSITVNVKDKAGNESRSTCNVTCIK